MRSILFLLVFFISSLSTAPLAAKSLPTAMQDSMKVIGIHPAVGKSITKQDKIYFKIFPEYNDSIFFSAYVILNTDSTYTLAVNTINNKNIKRPIDRKELDQIHFAIDNKSKEESIDYVQKDEDKKAIRKERANRTFMNVLAQIALVSFQVLLTASFLH